MKRLLVLCGLVALLLFVPAVFAGNLLPITISPASPSVGSAYTVSGCGYRPNTALRVVVESFTSTATLISDRFLSADLAGCFTTSWVADYVGSHAALVYDVSKRNEQERAYQVFTVT